MFGRADSLDSCDQHTQKNRRKLDVLRPLDVYFADGFQSTNRQTIDKKNRKCFIAI